MKITKKLVSLGLISLTFFSSIGSSFGYVSDNTYNSIDKFIDKYSDNKEALQKVESKITKAKEKYDENNYYNLNDKERDLIDTLNYINEKIYGIKAITKFQNTISEVDKKIADDEIVKLQLNLLDSATKQLKVLSDTFEKETNIVEKGDMKINLNIDKDDIGTLKSSLNLNEYTSTTSGFDSQIKGELVGLIDSNLKGQNAFKLKLSTFIDFISKDGNIYMLLEKLNIIEKENIENIQNELDQLEKIATQNKYITINDKNSEAILNTLKNLTPEKILSQGKITLGQPMLTAYKKEGDKYYLIPTKYACDTAKSIGNSFSMMYGFGGSNTCSDNEYKSLLVELSKSNTSIYLEIGDKSKIGFEIKENDTEVNGYITSSGETIDEIDLKIIPDQEKYPDEGFSMNYKKNSNLDISLNAEKGDINFKFTGELDNDDRFSFIDFSGKVSNNKKDILDTKLKLENNELDGDFKFIEDATLFTGNISGITGINNEIESINLDYNLDENNVNILNGKFNYLNNNFYFENILNDGDSVDFNLKCNGTYNPIDKNLSALNLEISSKSKPYGKNTLIENLKTKISLKNNIIYGYTIIKDNNGKDIFAIKTSGKSEKDYLELNNKMAFEDSYTAIDKISTYLINLNLRLDLRDNKNDVNIYIDANLSDKKVFDFEIDNKGTKEYKKSEIIAPTNIIDIKDLIPDYSPINDGYYNDSVEATPTY